MLMNLAHRGASAYAPENTMAAFVKGVDMGANGIETDVRRSRDGTLFLLHDDRLERTTDGHGFACDETWEQLRRLDAGSWFNPAFQGERLVSLEGFLRAFGGKDLFLAIELKAPNIEDQVLELLDRHGAGERVTLTAFEMDRLVQVRKLSRETRIGHLRERIDEQAIAELREIGAQQICPAAAGLTKDAVKRAKACGLEVRAWGINDEQVMRHALECGVDGMTVNFPDKLAAARITANEKVQGE